MIPGSKGLNPHELAHKWMKDLGIRPNIIYCYNIFVILIHQVIAYIK